MAEVLDRHRRSASVYSSHGYDVPIVCTCTNCTRTAQALADQEAEIADWRQEALRHLAQMLDIASKHVMIPQRKAAEDFLTEARGAGHPCTDLEAAARLSELRATESLAVCRSSFCSVAPDPHPRTGSCPPPEVPEPVTSPMHAAATELKDAAREILFEFHDGDGDDDDVNWVCTRERRDRLERALEAFARAETYQAKQVTEFTQGTTEEDDS